MTYKIRNCISPPVHTYHFRLLLPLLLFFGRLEAQIVPNGSFEQHSYYYNFINWVNPTTASPNYHHRNKTSTNGKFWVPQNYAGYQEPKGSTDSAYAGLYTKVLSISSPQAEYVEYVQAPLNKKLTGGNSYQVKFYVNFGGGVSGGAIPGSTNHNSGAYLKNIGAHFSSVGIRRGDTGPFSEVPQVVSNTWLTDTLNWTLIKGVIEVPDDSNYSFITIGCFGANREYMLTEYSNNGIGSYYFIDSVSIDSCFADAGLDSTICKGSYLDLPIPIGKNLTWSFRAIEGDMNSIQNGNRVSPEVTTKYVLTVINVKNCCCRTDTVIVIVKNCCNCPSTCLGPGPNKIQNGDFSAGNSGFVSDYEYNASDPSPGRIGVVPFVDYFSSAWWQSGNPGNFLYVDGATDTSKRAWSQVINNLTPGATYLLCLDLNNVMNPAIGSGYADPDVKIVINGKTLGNVVVEELPDTWLTYTYAWIADANTASIAIYDRNTIEQANDWAIDNLTFRQCMPNAGPDVQICDDISYTLPAPDNPALVWNYQVISGDMNSLSDKNIISPKRDTRYVLTVVNPVNNCSFVDTVKVKVIKCCPCPPNYEPGNELISNGNFESGNTGFLSQYTYMGSGQQTYWVTNNSNIANSGWNKVGNPNNFLVADGAYISNRYAWKQTVGVKKNKAYKLCLDYINLTDDSTDRLPIISIRINGETLANLSPDYNDPWNTYTYHWNSLNVDSARIEIYTNDTTATGNDFGIDNISFRLCAQKFIISAGPDTTICKGSSVSLPTAPSYQWTYQLISPGTPQATSGNIVSPSSSSKYVLSAYDPISNSYAYDTVNVVVKCCFCPPSQAETTNLLSNGDFSAGNTGFLTQYGSGNPTAPSAGSYWVQAHSSTVSSNWDKTGNPGSFLFADGALNTSNYVWKQSIPVQPGKDYAFCMEAINLNETPGFPAAQDPQVAVFINGNQMDVASLDETQTWTPVSASWNSGMSTVAHIEIRSLNSSAAGNDFGVDNITFKRCDEPSIPAMPEPGDKSSGENEAQGSLRELNIYPNPATNSIQVLLPPELISADKLLIIDMSGRIVKSIPVSENDGRDLSVSLSDIRAGIYTLVVYNKHRSLGKKLFLKK